MIHKAFYTVTDYEFFPGTMATVNSVLHFHRKVQMFVVVNHKHPLSAPQLKCLSKSRRVKVIDSRELKRDGRYINAWELKAHTAADYLQDYDVLVGIDSDCLLASNIDDEIADCHLNGGFAGGADGEGIDYDRRYAIYGFSTPVHNPKYMSTSLFLVANTPENQIVVDRWSQLCNSAVFNKRGKYPGHGDQGILNAVMFCLKATNRIKLLENHLWSQHWVYWSSAIDYRKQNFINRTHGGARQRTFHCGGAEKFWSIEHRNQVLEPNCSQRIPYTWFLANLWFGPCGDSAVDPRCYLPESSHHLIHDLNVLLPEIKRVYPISGSRWLRLKKRISIV